MDLSTIALAKSLHDLFESLRMKEDRLAMQYEDELATLHREASKLQKRNADLKYNFYVQAKAFNQLRQSILESSEKHKGSKPLKRGRDEAEVEVNNVVAEVGVVSRSNPTNTHSRDARVKFAPSIISDRATSTSTSAHPTAPISISTSTSSSNRSFRNDTNGNIPIQPLPAVVSNMTALAVAKGGGTRPLVPYHEEETMGALFNEEAGPPIAETNQEAKDETHVEYDYDDGGENSRNPNSSDDYAFPPKVPTTNTTASSSHRNSNNPSRPQPAISSNNNPPVRQGRCIEVVRNRNDRAALPGHTCDECDAFYNAMVQQGIVTEENKRMFLQSCSRHKARWTPPSTPEGYWDLSLHTPKEWK